MNGKDIILHFFYFIIYVSLQVFLLRNLVVFDVAFCFVYIAFLLLLPFDTNSVFLLLIGFLTGLLVDVFYDTLGIHAAACLLIAYLRPYVIALTTPRGGYDQNSKLTLQGMGVEWFALYVFILTFIHHLVLFFVEASRLDLFFLTILKAISSTLFTLIVIVLIQYLFYTSRSRAKI